MPRLAVFRCADPDRARQAKAECGETVVAKV